MKTEIDTTFKDNYLALRKIYLDGSKNSLHRNVFLALNALNIGRHIWQKYEYNAFISAKTMLASIVVIAFITVLSWLLSALAIAVLKGFTLKYYEKAILKQIPLESFGGYGFTTENGNICASLDRRCSQLIESNQSDWILLELFKRIIAESETSATILRYASLFAIDFILGMII